jgi:hypothetical protein
LNAGKYFTFFRFPALQYFQMKIDEGMGHIVAQDVKFDMEFGPLPVASLTGPQLIKFHDK